LRVRLLNTIYQSTAAPGEVIEVTKKRGEELIAGKEAVAADAPEGKFIHDAESALVAGAKGEGSYGGDIDAAPKGE